MIMKVQASEDEFALVGLKKIHLDLIVSLLCRVRLGESETKIAAYELLQELTDFEILPVSCSHEWPDDHCTIEV
jgi:hypothetical protein